MPHVSRYFAALVSIGLCYAPSAHAQADARFDGIWVGVETVTPESKIRPYEQKSIPAPHRCTIAIAQGGTQLGIIDGICPGRYPRVHRAGNTLSVSYGECKLQLTISSDGKTLMEEGWYSMPTEWTVAIPTGKYWPTSWLPVRISGTFHRLK